MEVQTNLQHFLYVLAQEIQEFDDAANAMKEAMRLTNAGQDALDRYGDIAGEPRNGASDADYRLRINQRKIFNRSSGTMDNLLEFVTARGTYNYARIEEFSGVVYIYTDNDTVLEPLFLTMVQGMAVAGVRVQIVHAPSGPVFMYVTEGGTLPTFGGTYGDKDHLETGGIYSSLVN